MNVTTLLQDLIRIPSVNPDGGGPAGTTGEKRVAEFVGGVLEKLGARVTYDEVLPGRPNVIGVFPGGAPGKPRVLFAPHTDTVGIEGMTIDPFGGEIRDGRLYGRGACDTKGTMAAMLAAFAQVGLPRLATLGAEITFVGLVAEETGQHGSRHFARHHPGYDFAIVGEPTRCAAVHVHKGCTWAKMETRGTACHGSTPERGKNAIYAMLPVLHALEDDFQQRLRDPRFAHPVLGPPTLNIGVIRGGSRTNIVPERCVIDLDIRETPALHHYGIERLLREFLAAAGLEKDVTLRLSPTCPPLDTPADHPFVQKLAALGTPLVGAPWLCDATWLAAEGATPGVAAGPGDIAQAHTADEFIEVAELERGVAFYRSFLEAL